MCFETWEQLTSHPRLADAAIIATVDRLHRDPAIACAGLGYQLLLEKPIAPEEAEAREIVEAAEAGGVLLMVCHVLRYTDYTQGIRSIIDSGRIGEVSAIQHLEPIGWWHFAHSFVRGNWGTAADSSSMLLSKSSHDIDWLSYIVGRPVRAVSSFGSLMEFTPERKPANAADRCLDCPLMNSCAYSAVKTYFPMLGDPVFERWPLGILDPEPTVESITQALREGPYGRCVYNGYNDAIDHQVVNIEYDGGATASFTVAAFTDLGFRKTRIFGTRGWIDGDGERFVVHDFVTDVKEAFDYSSASGASAADGHGGADARLIEAFLRLVADGAEGAVSTSGRESLATHQVVWAAEQARTDGTVVVMDDDRYSVRRLVTTSHEV